MAFPRRFKSATWYMRLSTGEVELTTAAALESAFRCGLANSRTPVREIGGHVWTTLAEAAEITDGPRGEIASLAPMALDDAPAADLASGTPWKVRRYVDPRSFRASRVRAVAALVAATAVFSAVALIGTRVPTNGLHEHISAAHQAHEAQVALETAAMTSTLSLRPVRDAIRMTREPEDRLTDEQKRRLRDRDVAMREHGVGLPTSRSLMAPRGSKDPFANSSKDPTRASTNNPWDPLNGAF